MDKLFKALQKLSKKEQSLIDKILELLEKGNINGLNIKKLKDRDDIFRIRKGRLRIIYKKNDDKIKLIMIDRRSDNTYKKL